MTAAAVSLVFWGGADADLADPDERRVLTVWNRRYRGWSLPGGKVEDGETLEAAQRRELEEETGMRTLAAAHAYHGPTCVPVGNDRGREVHLFRVEAFGEPREVEEGCPVAWMTPEEFLDKTAFREFYEEAFAVLGIT
jgi:ADP-ribose pyrophosphatase YjhB (NUDIX family)